MFHLLYYKCHKVNPNHGRSYIDFPDWIKNKKATVNPIKKKDNKCSQYTVIVSLNHKKIKGHAERITITKPFLNVYSWEGIHYPVEKVNWKKKVKK